MRRMDQSKNFKGVTVADFFAGIGLVSMGLGKAGWKTVYALDYDECKAAAYNHHFGAGHYHVNDIAKIHGRDVPSVTLAHASFPCTDLSVAGARGGIRKGESSSFWHFPRILKEMHEYPPFVLLENVEGLLAPGEGNGNDLRSILKKLNDLGYYVDLLRIDASHFVPQSRVRLFMIGTHENVVGKHDEVIQERQMRSSNARPKKIIDYIVKNQDLRWYFHPLPDLPARNISLEDIIDRSAEWWSADRSLYLYKQMHRHQQQLVKKEKESRKYSYFTAFRRMRVRDGESQSTAELRTDGIAGCLRTPKGGSAKQILVRVGRGHFDARLLNEKEVARLMGAEDFRINPKLSSNQVLFGFGDAVGVPVLEWIGTHYLNPLLPKPSAKVSTIRRAQLVH